MTDQWDGRPGDEWSAPELEFLLRWRPLIDRCGGQARAAGRLGWAVSTVSRDYTGVTLPTSERLDQLSSALRLSKEETLDLVALLSRARTARRARIGYNRLQFPADTGKSGLGHAAGLSTASGREFTVDQPRSQYPGQIALTPHGKYVPLRDYLASRSGDEESMTLSQLERLVGPLPDSAREHRAWWGNDDNGSQSQAWRAAGWHVASADPASGQVVFARGAEAGTSGPRQHVHTPDGFYIAAQVIAAIRAKEGTDWFDRSKLLRLIEELNDNYLRGNGYAAHALLRAILDHVPPLLKCSDFTAAVNNYQWSRTDKNYVRKLLDFKLQADDVLHRQISSKPDLLSLDDMPPRAWINRLLQECSG